MSEQERNVLEYAAKTADRYEDGWCSAHWLGASPSRMTALWRKGWMDKKRGKYGIMLYLITALWGAKVLSQGGVNCGPER